VLIGAMGSPDPYGMQLNGMGRGTTSTSKCVIVSPSERGGVDVDYLFAQVAVDRPHVDWTRSCGNLAAAAALYAMEEGLVQGPGRGQVRVAMWQVNRGQQIQAAVDGSTGQVWLEFQSPGGSHGRGLLPTGEVMTRLTVPGLGGVEVSVVDAANAFLFVRGADLGATLVSPVDLVGLLARAAVLRRAAAIASGLPVDGSSPRVLIVDPPQDYVDNGGHQVRCADIDIVARATAGRRLHHALPVTAAIATAVARAIPGSLVARIAAEGKTGTEVRVGHPSGIATVRSEVVATDDGWTAVRAEFGLTARRLMTGVVSLPRG